MPPLSSGCLVTRRVGTQTEVLLVHARGATFRRPLFGIPKGLVEPGEDPEQAAVRETLEETGLRVTVRSDLGCIRQKSGKIVQAYWATVLPESVSQIDSRGRCLQHDTENDVCRFYPLADAPEMMIPAQRELLTRLTARLNEQPSG